MPPSETTAATLGSAPAAAPARLCGWGGRAAIDALLARPSSPEAASAVVQRDGSQGAIARGLGRSYGDAAQLRGGLVLETSSLTGFELDQREGILIAQSGVTIRTLLPALVPRGWILPVLPGTQDVTIGGAIASDVHGKNHTSAGTFGAHVRQLGLLSAGGELLELTPDGDRELFEATLGGMGLTGVILWAEIALAPVPGALLAVDTHRVEDLDGALAALASRGGPHRVSWIDLLAKRPGRGVVTSARHVPGGEEGHAGATVEPRASVPSRWPGGILRPSTVRAFNELRFRRTPRRERDRLQGIGAHLFPLDALDAWPRLYGPGGLLQYQLAIPDGAEQVLHTVIARLRRSRVPCYLATLKDLGLASRAPLSFPLKGWTLALDVPARAPGVSALLDGFDELVAAAGGRVYLTKDARLSPRALAAMYPRLEQWRATRERVDPGGLWRSDLALRTGLVKR